MMSDITNFVALTDLIGTAGQPRADQYPAVREEGYEVVINLATPDSKGAIPNESEVVTAMGLSYFQIPVVWQEPTLVDFELFTGLMHSVVERKTFAHCVVNYRVSAFMFLYRTTQLGLDPVDAKADMEKLWTPSGVWEEYVDRILTDHDIDYFSI